MNTLYANSGFQSLAGLTVVGQTPTIVNGAMRIDPSTGGNFDNEAVEFGPTINTDAVDLVVRAKYNSGGGFGLAIGRRTINTAQACSFVAHLNHAASPATINWWSQATGGPSQSVGGANSLGLSIAPADVVRFSYRQRAATITAHVDNLTQGTSGETSITTSLVSGGAFFPPNTSVAKLCGLGGQFDVLDLLLLDQQPTRPTLACLGDSKTAGYAAVLASQRYASQLTRFGGVAVYAGSGDRTIELLAALPSILANLPQQALLAIGSNDLRFGVATAIWQANYRQITATLEAAGVNVVHLLPIPETGVDQTALRAFILANFTKTIDPSVGWVNATHLSSDSIHPSPAGHALIAAIVTASTLLASANNADVIGIGGIRSMSLGF